MLLLPPAADRDNLRLCFAYETESMPPASAGLKAEIRYTKQAEHLAMTVRQLRQTANATLQDIAERSGLARSTLSKIENGQLSPTYETLLRLADGLQVDIAELFTPEGVTDIATGRRSVTRHGQGKRHVTPQYLYEMFCADLSRKSFTPLVTTIRARKLDEFPAELPRHEGEEFVYVISGEIELYSEHYEPTRLGAGDGCYFDSTMAHACISVSKRDAVVLWIASHADGLSARPSGVVQRLAPK